MSYEEVNRCRLCSSQRNLISMFSGKSRTIRDFLRKMIEETVHIQIKQCDPIYSVCFDCSIDVSNFYFFKFNCLQNEDKFQERKSSPCKTKKLKLHSLDLTDIPPPDIKSAEHVLLWLTSKRISLMKFSEESKQNINRDTQTIQIHCDVAVQTNTVKTICKNSQTMNSNFADSKTQCDLIKSYLPFKKELKNQSSQTKNWRVETVDSECRSCRKQRFKKPINKHSQTTTILHSENSCHNNMEYHRACIDISAQTEVIKVVSRYSQTYPRKLTSELFQTSIVTDVCTQDGYVQTDVLELVDKYIQTDILKLNGYKNGTCSRKANDSLSAKESKNMFKLTNQKIFTDASKSTQTDLTMSPWEQLNISKTCYVNEDSYLLSPTLNAFLKDVDPKLGLKIPYSEKLKTEIISPTESLTIFTMQSPKKDVLLSPQSSDLLQVDTNKSDNVIICKLCDKTLYDKKEQMIHNKTHMQCNFCKRKFRSLKAAQTHINSCKVKEADFVPFVDLVRIEQIFGIREKYIKAFKRFSL